MKSGDEVRKRTVRMVLAAVKQAEVDKRIELDDMAVMNLIQKEVKNRREAIEEAKKANRADLIRRQRSRDQSARSLPAKSHARRGFARARASRHREVWRGGSRRYG